MIQRVRKWRLNKARLRLAEAEHDYVELVRGWTYGPCEIRPAAARLTKARLRIDRLEKGGV